MVLPSANYDPKIGHQLLNRYLDEFRLNGDATAEAFRRAGLTGKTRGGNSATGLGARPGRLAERRCHNKKRRRHRLEKSPAPRNGPRSTPPGPVGACISENARASGNSYLHGRRRISGSRRQTKPFAARWGPS